jgi:ribose/xylose/arabinose/galactoside ABC-type transport system permease subunit
MSGPAGRVGGAAVERGRGGAAPVLAALGRVPALVYVVLALCIVFSQLTPYFLTTNNLLEVLRQSAVLGVLALGMTLLMISGSIDLSVGSAMSLIGVVAGKLLEAGQPAVAVVFVALALGVAAAVLQGGIAMASGVHPFIITLGGFTAFAGLALWASGGSSFSIGESFDALAFGTVAGVPIVLVVFGLAVAAASFLLRRMRLGRNTYAIGGNETAAYLSGVRLGRTKVLLFALAGLSVGLATILLLSRGGTASPSMGVGYEIKAITAVVIGGTQLSGGRGSVSGTVLGVLLLGVISNALTLLAVPLPLQGVVIGGLLIVATVTDHVRRRLVPR